MGARHKINQFSTLATLLVVGTLCENTHAWWMFGPLALGMLWLLHWSGWIRPDRTGRRR